MDFSCYYRPEEDQSDLELLTKVSESIESFIENEDKYQMFVHIPVEEFGKGTKADTASRWDRFVRVAIETICQYYTKEFKSRNDSYFNKYARRQNRQSQGAVIVNGKVIKPNTVDIEHAVQSFENRNFAQKELQYSNRFLVNSYTNIKGGMMAMPHKKINGLYSPLNFINGQLRVNDIRGYDIVLIIGDYFYSESFINDVIQDFFNREATTKLIVMGTYRPKVEWCSEHEIRLEDLEKIYDFNFAKIENHNLMWENLNSFRDGVRNFLATNIDTEEPIKHRIEKLLISPFIHNLLPITSENYRTYLGRLFDDNEYCNFLSDNINSDSIIKLCEECKLFDDSPKYKKYKDILSNTENINKICVVNYDSPKDVEKKQFIKVRSKDNNPTRGVVRNKDCRCFILYTYHKNTLDLLERYCIGGYIHVLTYQGFDGSLEESSEDWYGWENYYPKKGYKQQQQYYDVTLEDKSSRRIYGSVIFDNKIISSEDLCDIIGKNTEGNVYRVTTCNDSPELLDRYIKAKYPTTISNQEVSWADGLRKKLEGSCDDDAKRKLWNECQKYGYTFERYFDNTVAYPKRYDDLKAILNFLGLDDTIKRSIIKAAHNHNLKGSRGKEMKEEILNYNLTGVKTHIDEDHNSLLEELFVIGIKKTGK